MNINLFDHIQAIGPLVSFFTSIAAIVISVIAVKQTQQSIENAARPYVTIYYKYISIISLHHYFVIKNLGQSEAIITKFKCSQDLSQLKDKNGNTPFSHIINTSFAPGENMVFYLENLTPMLNKLKDGEVFIFDIEYRCGRKKYKNHITVNPLVYDDTPISRQFMEGSAEKVIAYALQDMIEKML